MFGLDEKELRILKSCFSHQPLVSKAVVFGSRAMGNYKRGSDIDIAIFGDGITGREQSEIINEFEESNLPYEMDILIYDSIKSGELKKHIQEYGKELYRRKK